MSQKALIVWGGWDGHEPKQVAEIYRGTVEAKGSRSRCPTRWMRSRTRRNCKSLSLIVPVWTMGKDHERAAKPVSEAVKSGVGHRPDATAACATRSAKRPNGSS